MATNFKANRELARELGIDTQLVNVYTKQKGYGKQSVYMSFNPHHFGVIEDLFICHVFPNIDEQFDNFNESGDQDLTHAELIIDRFGDYICNYLESVVY